MFTKECPKCGKEMSYMHEGTLKRSIKNNSACRPCSKRGVKRKPFTEEAKRNMGLAQKGKKRSEEFKRKCSLRMMGNKLGIGNRSNRGKKTSEEQKAKLSLAMTGKKFGPCPEERKRNISLARGGDGIINKKYDMAKLVAWTKAVKERDEYICQQCNYVGVPGLKDIDAHHILPKARFPQYAYDLDNGISLCKTCHKVEHYGSIDHHFLHDQ